MTSVDCDTEALPQHLTLPALFALFLHFGCLAFGGPVAQIAMIRQALVSERQWISPVRFNRLLAVMQVLPGPEAHEMCVHFGMIARGRIGGLLAGLGFMLPGFLLMLAAGALYTRFAAGRPTWDAALLGVQIVVVAIIMRAVQKIGAHVLEDWRLWTLAGLAAVTTLAGAPFWIPLIGAALLAMLGGRPAWMFVAAAGAVLLVAAIAARGDGGTGAPVAIAGGAVTTLALFVAGLKGGLLTFGGAYTAIPYVRADTVGRGWIDDAAFLDGLAIAGVLPAPLVIFATFTGYLAGGPAGALAITAGMFLPAFAFSMIFFERLEALVADARLHQVLAGVAAAAVGIIAATSIALARSVAERADWRALPLFAIALLIAWRWKSRMATPALVLAGGVAGWLALG